nr:amidohydrolase family protein [Moorella sulfitireducens]
MLILKPSVVGTTNEKQAELVERYPNKFRAYCADQMTKIKAARGESKWSLEAAAQEVEDALKTGKYVGIGEFVPRDWRREKIYSFEERLEEYRVFMELARKYNVVVDFHEFAWNYEWDVWKLLLRIASEYPDVPIVVCHGGHSIGAYIRKEDYIRRALEVAGFPLLRESNVFLEVGTWPAEYMKIAIDDPNVGPTRLLWGGDYGHVPQYIVSCPVGPESSICATAMKKFPAIPSYQIDWWGWQLHQIRKLKDWYPQDIINLILGGNAAKLYKLPVPYERMFLDGRPDVYGVDWEKSIPFIPKNLVINPD